MVDKTSADDQFVLSHFQNCIVMGGSQSSAVRVTALFGSEFDGLMKKETIFNAKNAKDAKE